MLGSHTEDIKTLTISTVYFFEHSKMPDKFSQLCHPKKTFDKQTL